MKVLKKCPWLILVTAVLIFPIHPSSGQQKPPTAQPAAEQQEEYTEEEYDAYEKATQEKDLDKRQALLLAFMDKYPKSKLQSYIVTGYQTMLFELQKSENWQKLEPAAEAWLRHRPNDLHTMGFAADAAQRLGHDQKFLDYGLKLYEVKPNGGLAFVILQSYKRLGNNAKDLEWTEALFKYPEFDDKFDLRMVFVKKYADDKNFKKAAEYAVAALKSFALAKKPGTTSDADWKKASVSIKRNCNFVIGISLYEGDKFADAIASLEQAVKAEAFDVAFYYIGLSLWRLDRVEDAMHAFAKAILLKGEVQGEARGYLEKLYKAMHNNTLIGIDKVYRKAETELAEERAAR